MLALSVVQSHLGMCVSVQLCDAQGAAQFPFVHLPPRVRRPFTGAPVHNMSLTHAERLPVGQEAEELCASGQCATAAVALKLAVDLGHLPSRALLAYIFQQGRAGVANDSVISMIKSIELVEEGARLGCQHCQGVMAFCHWMGYGCVKDQVRLLELAHESSRKGSRYGQFYLGFLLEKGCQGLDPVDPFGFLFKKPFKIKQMFQKLYDCTVLQRRRGMILLRTTLPSCLLMVDVLRRTLQRLCDCIALQRHRVTKLLR